MNDSNSDLEGRSDEYRICCLIDDGTRCHRQASNASYSKRIQRTVSQRHLKLTRESHVSTCVEAIMALKILFFYNRFMFD